MNGTLHIHEVTRIVHKVKQRSGTRWAEFAMLDDNGDTIMTLVAFSGDTSRVVPEFVIEEDEKEAI